MVEVSNLDKISMFVTLILMIIGMPVMGIVAYVAIMTYFTVPINSFSDLISVIYVSIILLYMCISYMIFYIMCCDFYGRMK